MTFGWSVARVDAQHPEGPGNRQEATSDSPGRSGRRVHNHQTRFSQCSIPYRALAITTKTDGSALHVCHAIKGAGAEADGGGAAPRVGPSEGQLDPDIDHSKTLTISPTHSADFTFFGHVGDRGGALHGREKPRSDRSERGGHRSRDTTAAPIT
jgi:hypothetical protein